jgi:hypothetical protein
MSLFKHLFKVLSLYLEGRIRTRNRIKVQGRIRIKVKSRIRIRIKVMRFGNTAYEYIPYSVCYTLRHYISYCKL